MLPEYLRKGALETFSVGMVKDLMHSVLGNTFDDEKEDDYINKIANELIQEFALTNGFKCRRKVNQSK